jgi:hypothetical protein
MSNANGKKRFALAMKIMMEPLPAGLSGDELAEFKRERLRRAYAVTNPHPHVTRVNNGSKGRSNNVSKRANGSKANNVSKRANGSKGRANNVSNGHANNGTMTWVTYKGKYQRMTLKRARELGLKK